MLTIDQVLAYRMSSLLLYADEARTPSDVVTWFGAMQAQDVASGEWSFGVRCGGTTQTDIHQATVNRQMLRTWPMRGTVHFVPPQDAGWMLEVTGSRALAGAVRRRAQLGLTDDIVSRAVDTLAEALRGGQSLTRAECVALLIDQGLHTSSEHGYHLLSYASHVGAICMGPQLGSEQTFVRLDEWVPHPNRLTRNEALATFALRYFRSHGPATRNDFVGWTGLTVGDAKQGIESAGDALIEIETVCGPMVMASAALGFSSAPKLLTDRLLLLPGFDEYILGYKDRTAMVAPERMNDIVPGGNGVFKPTIVANGRVIGTWKRTIKRHHVDLQPFPFESLTKGQLQQFTKAGRRYADYLQLEPNIVDPD